MGVNRATLFGPGRYQSPGRAQPPRGSGVDVYCFEGGWRAGRTIAQAAQAESFVCCVPCEGIAPIEDWRRDVGNGSWLVETESTDADADRASGAVAASVIMASGYQAYNSVAGADFQETERGVRCESAGASNGGCTDMRSGGQRLDKQCKNRNHPSRSAQPQKGGQRFRSMH